jgi:hypothetical protein
VLFPEYRKGNLSHSRSLVQQPNAGHWRLIFEVSRSHTTLAWDTHRHPCPRRDQKGSISHNLKSINASNERGPRATQEERHAWMWRKHKSRSVVMWQLSLHTCYSKSYGAAGCTRLTVTLYEDAFTFMTTSRWILLRMKNLSDKTCRDNKDTHFMFSNVFTKIVSFMR